jgi:hypothetical protein
MIVRRGVVLGSKVAVVPWYGQGSGVVAMSTEQSTWRRR